ncbi:MAG: DUF3631 domain-containing protein [Legionellaceae bacterium]|nr:DUF3631 domain-containing protein [Legionellaceae bacterium]
MNDTKTRVDKLAHNLELIQGNNIVDEALKRLNDDPGAVFEEAVLKELTNIRSNNPAKWQRLRNNLKNAKVQLSEIDRLTTAPTDNMSPETTIIFQDEMLWPDAVDGSELLDALVQFIACHIIADLQTIRATALWIVFTWFIDVVDVAPIANITAPEKRCGKSELLALLGLLVQRPLLTANIGPAPMFRLIHKYNPTLLIDEIDTFLSVHDDMRGILNAGFSRSAAFVYRCVGDAHDVQPFSVWGAKALCGIGGVDKIQTLADRSIPLRLRRKLPDEEVIKVRHHDKNTASILRQKLARFAQENKDNIRAHQNIIFQELHDRANDCWEPLFAIASIVEDRWLKIAKEVAMSLHGVEKHSQSIGEQLLASIKIAFAKEKMDGLSTINLLKELTQHEELPWRSWDNGSPMKPHQLSKLLENYDIKSKGIRIGKNTVKGYKRMQFEAAFKYYIP